MFTSALTKSEIATVKIASAPSVLLVLRDHQWVYGSTVGLSTSSKGVRAKEIVQFRLP